MKPPDRSDNLNLGRWLTRVLQYLRGKHHACRCQRRHWEAR